MESQFMTIIDKYSAIKMSYGRLVVRAGYLHGLGDLVLAAAGLLEAHERAAQQAHGRLLGHGAALQAHALVVVREQAVVVARQRQQRRARPLHRRRAQQPPHLPHAPPVSRARPRRVY